VFALALNPGGTRARTRNLLPLPRSVPRPPRRSSLEIRKARVLSLKFAGGAYIAVYVCDQGLRPATSLARGSGRCIEALRLLHVPLFPSNPGVGSAIPRGDVLDQQTECCSLNCSHGIGNQIAGETRLGLRWQQLPPSAYGSYGIGAGGG